MFHRKGSGGVTTKGNDKKHNLIGLLRVVSISRPTFVIEEACS
jgi:hypothetical protein